MTKKRTKKEVKKKKIENFKFEIFYSLVAYFIVVFFINLWSGGSGAYLLDPAYAVEFLGAQISILTGASHYLGIALGILVSLIPLAFVYTLIKDLRS